MMMIYLTAIGLTPGGSSTVHTYKQYIEQYYKRLWLEGFCSMSVNSFCLLSQCAQEEE